MSPNHFHFVTIICVDKLKDDHQDPDRFPSLYIGFFVLLHSEQAGSEQSRWWTSVVCWSGFCVGFFKASCCVSVSLNVEASATLSPLSVTTVCFIFRISPKERVQYFIQMFKGSHITEDTGPKTWFLKSSFKWVVLLKLIRPQLQLHTQSVLVWSVKLIL